MFAIFLALAAPGELVTQVVVEEGGEPMMPATNPGSWATNDDYPVSAMREEREGTTGFKLTVGADGLPTQCEIISPSGHDDLDATTCRLIMERARFTPGRDKAGKAVGGTYSNRIRWQIPEYDDSIAVAGFALDAVQESWPRGPRPDDALTRIDPAAHYPAAARAAGEEGVVHMELGIDAAGQVTSCKVNESSLSFALDEAACALMRSDGKFSPALDSDGKPVRSVVATTFRWTLPEEAGEGPGGVAVQRERSFPMGKPGSATVTVLLGADGRVADCRFSKTGEFGSMPNGMTPCDMFPAQGRYAPFVGSDGKPAAKRVTLRTELVIEDAPPPAEAKPAPVKPAVAK
ncbi:TonB family protein [Sphingopyxis sp. JAI128]|uniref:TonB family protein n=1 Tax=Sphingopyxis sp. JAI128 TaxID=2723066 RepID=UPI0016150206|nr:TonB family protein [Sphingopyxis sp. JAI128]MBB6428091.1 TonB family protein [Sphingopyxis sp. JAI128]